MQSLLDTPLPMLACEPTLEHWVRGYIPLRNWTIATLRTWTWITSSNVDLLAAENHPRVHGLTKQITLFICEITDTGQMAFLTAGLTRNIIFWTFDNCLQNRSWCDRAKQTHQPCVRGVGSVTSRCEIRRMLRAITPSVIWRIFATKPATVQLIDHYMNRRDWSSFTLLRRACC